MMTTGAKNTDGILLWCREHRPDLVENMRKIIEDGNPAFVLMMTSSFEAGRMFQAKRATPNSYAPCDVDYMVAAPVRIA